MASIIKANQLQDFGGNSIITSDGAGNLTTQKTNYPAFSARMNANQTISTGTWTKANFNTEILDTNGKYDTSNYKFTPGVTGYYRISAHGYLQGTDGNLGRVAIYKNGSEYNFTHNTYPNNNYQTQQIQVVMYLDADDYVEAYFRQDAGSDKILLGENGNENNFAGYRIGS
jgi:hypothetical protein